MPDNFLEGSEGIMGTEGYESVMVEGNASEHFEFFNSEEESSTQGKSKTGKDLGQHWANAIKGTDFVNNIFFNRDNKVFGLPFKYSKLSDPMSRVFLSTFETDTTCIAFIKFGVPRFNKLLYQKLSAASNDDVSISLNVVYALKSTVDPNTNSRDSRLVTFKPSNAVFMKYALASINQVYTLLDLPGKFDATGFDAFDNNGFAFYCVKTGALNEGVNNDYTVPDIIDKMNSDAAIKRQNYQMYGTYGHVETDQQGTATAWLENLKNGLIEKISEDIGNNPIIGSVASAFMKSNKGSMGYYGKVWADSKSENSYSLSFKFRSPYGSKLEIFKNVFFPFLLLHTAAIPKQDGRFSYQEPFMVMIDFPGWFRVNCGVITQLSWTKGGDNQLWNIDGLPLEMTVTMQVEDLYPIQLASEDVTVMEYNWGLLNFLENMAGLTTTQVASVNHSTNLASNLRITMAESDGSIVGNLNALIKAKFRTVGNRITNPVATINNAVNSFSYLGARGR